MNDIGMWEITKRSLGLSFLCGLVGSLGTGVLSIYNYIDAVPLIASVANSSKVIWISSMLAILITWGVFTFAFEEMGVLLGFIVLSTFGFAVLCLAFCLGQGVFDFLRGAIAGLVVCPIVAMPCLTVSLLIVTKLKVDRDR
jgi:hypothetical protein